MNINPKALDTASINFPQDSLDALTAQEEPLEKRERKTKS